MPASSAGRYIASMLSLCLPGAFVQRIPTPRYGVLCVSAASASAKYTGCSSKHMVDSGVCSLKGLHAMGLHDRYSLCRLISSSDMTFTLCNAGGTLEQRLPSEHGRVRPGCKAS